MGKHNYYFLVAGLPDLTIEQGKLHFGSIEFRDYLKEQLHQNDYALVEWLFLPHDNQNLLKLIYKNEFQWNNAGIYSREIIEQAFTEEPLLLKAYLHVFINNFRNETRLMPQMSLENELTTLYYNEALVTKNEFLRAWLEFELNLKNVLLFTSAQNYNLSYENELIGNNTMTNALKQKSGRETGEAREWAFFERTSQIVENGDLATRERAIDHLRWTFLDEANTYNYFSVEVILSYLIKLTIIERWLKLDPKTGEELFRHLLGDLQSGYEFPNEFNVNDGKK